LMDCK